MKIQHTTDYSIFSNNPHQREFKKGKVQRLMEKMKKNGFTPSMAISVYSDSTSRHSPSYTINAGHHRLAAAKALNIPVPFIVEHKWSINELSDEGSFVTAWPLKDHVSNYAKMGIPAYCELLRLESIGLNISQAASLLNGEAANSGNYTSMVKAGEFKIKTNKIVNLWLDMHGELGERIPCLRSRNFVSCWSKCIFTEEFDHDIFLKRLRANPTMLEKTGTESQMLKSIEEIYNYKAGKKIPLAFLAEQNSRARYQNFHSMPTSHIK